MDRPIVCTTLFSPSIRDAFQKHIQETPNNRRMSRIESTKIIQWLTDPASKPTSQQESSRRNYIRKRFWWDNSRSKLLAHVKGSEVDFKEVVVEDCIVDVVESVHVDNGHGGWDATWNDTAKCYYGILRADVIFLVKQCTICAQDPRKRPKRTPECRDDQANLEAGDDCESNIVNQREYLLDDFLLESRIEAVNFDTT